ncbi:Protein C25F9.2 protein, partial [Aphelenchoides avenae]
MTELVEKLFQDCPALPRGLPAYVVETHVPMIQAAYNLLYPGKYRILVFDEFGRYQPCYKGPPAKHDICIVHSGNRAGGTAHFEGVRCVNTLFGKSYYCPECETAFEHKVAHSGKCIRKCRGCGGFGSELPCRGGLRIECSSCNGIFVSRECYERHQGRMCERFHVCKECGVSYNTDAAKRLTRNKKHECGQKFCSQCCTYHRAEQPCYIQPVDPKVREQPYRIVAYDFECSQHTRPDPDKEWYLHEVTCSECIAKDQWKDLSRRDCRICGGLKEVTWSAAEGKNPLSEFVSWILHSFDKSFHTYAFAHYGGRYDMQLVVSEILRMGGLEPEVVRTGHKLYEVKVEKRGVVVPTFFRDSYCLMSQPLGDLVDAYKLGIEEKQYFPHLYNKPSNYKRRLRHLPKRKYYAPETMKPEKRKAFKTWYRENRNAHFFLPDKLREYCCNDVQILMHALVAFRREWMEVCQDDVLRNSMTIASAPEHGYERHDRQSVVALKYLKWYAKSHGVVVRHRDSTGGEYKLEYTDAEGRQRHFMLDGYVERPGQRPLALEFHGCAYHGCNRCYRDDTVCANGRTAVLNRGQTEAREAIIRQHMDLHVVWECQVAQMLKERCDCKCDECNKCKDSDKCECSMKQFFDDALPWGPIDPRDAHFG